MKRTIGVVCVALSGSVWADCGTYLNPCYTRPQQTESPTPFGVFDLGKSMNSGLEAAGKATEIEQKKRDMARERAIASQSSQLPPGPSLLSGYKDWAAGYDAGYSAAQKEIPDKFTEELARLIYTSDSDQLKAMDTGLEQRFANREKTYGYHLLKDALKWRESQLGENIPSGFEIEK